MWGCMFLSLMVVVETSTRHAVIARQLDGVNEGREVPPSGDQNQSTEHGWQLCWSQAILSLKRWDVAVATEAKGRVAVQHDDGMCRDMGERRPRFVLLG